MPNHSTKRRRVQSTKQRETAALSSVPIAGTKAEIQQLAHDLQLHQVELEMQNQALRDTQAELEATRDRYASLYDFAPVGYATLDEQGIIREANLTLSSFLQTSRIQLEGRPFLTFVRRTHKPAFLQLFGQCQATGDKHSAELLLRAGGDSSIVVQAVMQRSTPPGSAGHYLLALMDTTEKVRAERVSRESQDRLEDALRATHVAAWSLDLVTDTVTQSDNARTVLGGPPEGQYQIHKEVLEDIHLDDRQRHRQIVRQAIEQRSSYTAQYRLFSRSTGELRWLEEHGRVIAGADGQPLRLQGVIFSITERKQMEEALRANYQRMINFIAESSDPIVLLDGAGVVECISRKAAALLGYAPEELMGRKAGDFVHQDDLRLAAPQRETLQREFKNVNALLRVRQKDDGWVLVDAGLSLMFPGNPTGGFVAVFSRIEISGQKEEDNTTEGRLPKDHFPM